MFDKQYRFKGRHASRVNALRNVFEAKKKTALFPRNIDVYVSAPLIGFLFQRRAEQDNTKDPSTNQVYDENIFVDRVIDSKDDLMFDYQLIMLLDKEYEPDEDKRIDKAFRYAGKDPADLERFESYVRGGVDVLYEKLVEGDPFVGDRRDPESYIKRVYFFMKDRLEEYKGKGVKSEEVMKLCK